MKTSDSIKELSEALNKAQKAMTGAKKDSSNPFFKSKYSDLTAVMEAISGPFADNGLSFIQSPEYIDGMIAVVTRILHVSGEWCEGTVQLPPVKNDAQGYGSAITYGKRYGLQAMAGVPSIDDDGNDAVKAADVAASKQKAVNLTDAIMRNKATIDAIKLAVQAGEGTDEFNKGAEAYYELSDDDKRALWVAPTKGGPFTTVEREVIKSKAWHDAYYGGGSTKE